MEIELDWFTNLVNGLSDGLHPIQEPNHFLFYQDKRAYYVVGKLIGEIVKYGSVGAFLTSTMGGMVIF